MKIPNELTPIAYQLSKKVYEHKLTFKEGLKQLVGENRINPNSAVDYINNFRRIIKGKRFTRTLNAYTIEYFFENIYRDYGITGLISALTALKLHIEYYEGLSKRKTNTMRKIYEKYLAISKDTPDEQEQNEIIHELKRQKKTKLEIAEELKNLKPSDPEQISINSKAFKRDNYTIAQIKLLRDFKCQICGINILKKDGSFYVEGAHIKDKRFKGNETPENILILCPNHHKEFDIGKRSILRHSPNEIQFILNGQKYTISLKID